METKKLEAAVKRTLEGVAEENYDIARCAIEDLVECFGLEIEITEDSDVIVDETIVPVRNILVKITKK